jgi:hypothetical protein
LTFFKLDPLRNRGKICRMKEQLLLCPGEHWEGDDLKGISIHINKLDGGNLGDFVGAICIKPMNLNKAVEIVMCYLDQCGYDALAILDGQLVNSDGQKIKAPFVKNNCPRDV